MLNAQTVIDGLNLVREQRPLVLSLTNYVVMNVNANALLAVGASPIMAHSPQELPELIEKVDSVVINLGTLDDTWLKSMHYAIELANRANKWVVLDPVGCGFTQYRTEAAQRLARLANRLLIRGNSQEIQALLSFSNHNNGLDDHSGTVDIMGLALSAQEQFQAHVVISGQHDALVFNQHRIINQNGHPWMTQVTGMGCTLSALLGAFLPCDPNAPLSATSCWTLAGQVAAQHAQGYGSFMPAILDQLHQLTPTKIQHLQAWSHY